LTFGSRTKAIRTSFYVDGNNLFYGSLKGTAWKWLDLSALFARVLPPPHVVRNVRYFTARVMASPPDESRRVRQETYLLALENHCPEIAVHFGRFSTHKACAPLAQPEGEKRTVRVLRTQEKGTDVNLAVHLVNDAWMDDFDCAVLVSNDSDFAEALRLVKERHDKQIGLLTPGNRRPTRDLLECADFSRRISPSDLSGSQLPDPIPGTDIRRPQGW